MGVGSVGRRWIVRGLLVGLMGASGCRSTQIGQADPMKVEPMHDIKMTDQNAGSTGLLHDWFAQQRIKQLAAAQNQ
jgi:hypothetical protein